MSVAEKVRSKANSTPFLTKTFKPTKVANSTALQLIANSGEVEIVNRYDYNKVTDESVRSTLQDLETVIRKSIRQERTAGLNIGKALLEAKSLKQWGDFENWVAKSFPDFSKRTSDHYMALARAFGETFDIVSYLPAQTLYKLAEGKKLHEVRAEVIEKAQGGSRLSKSDVQSRISQVHEATAMRKPAQKPQSANDAKDQPPAANGAVALLLEKLDGDFLRFVELFNDAGEAFTVALNDAAQRMAARRTSDA